MNRRGFLTSVAALLAGATFDKERALWIRGAKLISIPKVRVPTYHRLAVSFELGVDASFWDRALLTEAYLVPAVAALEKQMDKFVVHRVDSLALPPPCAAERSEYFTTLGAQHRLVVAYDGNRPDPRYIGRVDCAFWGMDR